MVSGIIFQQRAATSISIVILALLALLVLIHSDVDLPGDVPAVLLSESKEQTEQLPRSAGDLTAKEEAIAVTLRGITVNIEDYQDMKSGSLQDASPFSVREQPVQFHAENNDDADVDQRLSEAKDLLGQASLISQHLSSAFQSDIPLKDQGVTHASKSGDDRVLQLYEEKQASGDSGTASVEAKAQNQTSEVEKMKIKSKEDELETHLSLLADQMKAKQVFQEQKMKNKLDVISTEAEIEQELPRKIPGLHAHFGNNHALAGTEGRPFQEVHLRHQQRAYNKLRDSVVSLTHKLAQLEQKAADQAAAAKFNEKQAAMDAEERRQHDADEDAIYEAKFPQEYRDKLTKVKDAMMQSARRSWKKEREAQLRKEAGQAAAYVSEDQKRITEIKGQLESLMS